MRFLDRELQRQRIKVAAKHLPKNSGLLDIGCADGRIFQSAKINPAASLGLDIDDSMEWLGGPVRRLIGRYEEVSDQLGTFEAISMLATCEHLTQAELETWLTCMVQNLVSRGRVVITMPSPAVDKILHAAIRMRLLDGMEAHAHHGADPNEVEATFIRNGYQLIVQSKFQFGLNNLLVFQAP
jgi:2-polyprenyl-3-methyl-5-hydroxy-6-metoxy-1,4-benzoquinol methylase